MININNIGLLNTEINYIKQQKNNTAGKSVLREMSRTCNVLHSKTKKTSCTITSKKINRSSSNSINIKTMAPGRYTYMFEYNIKTNQVIHNLGKVHNPLEWRSRHYQLKSNDPDMYVFAAGEIEYNGTGIRFNFLTGTYMKIFTNYSVVGNIVIKLFTKLFPGKIIEYYDGDLLYPGEPIEWTQLPNGINFDSIKPTKYKQYLKQLIKVLYGPIKDKLVYSKKEKFVHQMMKDHVNKMVKSAATYENLLSYYNNPKQSFN